MKIDFPLLTKPQLHLAWLDFYPNPQLGMILIKEIQFSDFYIFRCIEVSLLLSNGLIVELFYISPYFGL